MALVDEIQTARKKVITDGYEMSLGEIINLYKDDELVIDPVFQRLFRWTTNAKPDSSSPSSLGFQFHPFSYIRTRTGSGNLLMGYSACRPSCNSLVTSRVNVLMS